MPYSIVLTTAEDIVGVVDAVLAKSIHCDEKFISEFSDLTEIQVKNAIHMTIELNLISEDTSKGLYKSDSSLARLLVSSRSDDHKAAIMRFTLEQYVPFIDYIDRFTFTQNVELASKQIKALHCMSAHARDIKNTIISVGTYAKVIKSEGANSYSFNQEDVTYIDLLENSLSIKSMDDTTLRNQLGEDVFSFIDYDNVFKTLGDSYSKTQNLKTEPRAPITYAGNAFESFLGQIALKHNVSLIGKNGIIQKSDALSNIISKKHRGMINYIGQIRNAIDHGSDIDEGGAVWDISPETARLYPFVVATIIKSIVLRENHSWVI